MNKISIKIEDYKYTEFLSYELSQNIENLVKIFSFTINIPSDNSIIKEGDEVVIDIDGEEFLTGFIEIVNKIDQGDKSIIQISGRDNLCDLVDSKIGAKIYKTPISFIELCKDVLKTLNYDVIDNPNNIRKQKGVSVINKYGDISILQSSDDVVHRDNDSAFEVIKRCADKRQLILNSDGSGNLIINDIGGEVCNTLLQRIRNDRNSNILSSNVDIDYSKRFYKYVVKSIPTANGNATSDTTIDPLEPIIKEKGRGGIRSNTINATGISYDDEIRKNRIYTTFRQVSSPKEVQRIAEWENNIRKAQSFVYNCAVWGFRQNLDEDIKKNPLWRVNSLVDVVDDIKNVIGRYLIKSVKYTKNENGTKSEMVLIDKKAYTESLFEPLVKRIKGSGNKGKEIPIEPPM